MSRRVISGEAKGRKLIAPRNDRVRPATDRLKEALFNILGSVEGEVVLDLFAGTGSLAIEALSRGARHAILVDNDKTAISAIRHNVDNCQMSGRATVVFGDVVETIRRYGASPSKIAESPIDLVFVDPPYRQSEDYLGELAKELGRLAQKGVLSANARFSFERPAGSPPPPLPFGFEVTDERKYGQTILFLAAGAENVTNEQVDEVQGESR